MLRVRDGGVPRRGVPVAALADAQAAVPGGEKGRESGQGSSKGSSEGGQGSSKGGTGGQETGGGQLLELRQGQPSAGVQRMRRGQILQPGVRGGELAHPPEAVRKAGSSLGGPKDCEGGDQGWSGVDPRADEQKPRQRMLAGSRGRCGEACCGRRQPLLPAHQCDSLFLSTP